MTFALVCLMAGGCAVIRPPTAPEVFQVTSLPGRQIQPSLSPDGTRVAFAWDGELGDNFDIYVKPLRSNGIVRLTTDGSTDRSPAWSPDGRFIAFLRELPDNRHAVYVVPAAGGPEHPVTIINTVVAGIAWTPDSRNLIVPDGPLGRSLALFLLAVATGERHQLTEHRSVFHPAISPDGRTLAFASDESGPDGLSTIWLQPLNANYLPVGSAISLRETTGPKAFFPSWAQDGQSLLYSIYTENHWNAYRVTLSNHKVERLSALGTGVNQTQEIPGGGMLFAREVDHFLIAEVGAESPGSVKPGPAFRTVEDDYGPSLSPDGQWLAFISNRSGVLSLWVAEPDGTNARKFATPGAIPARPRWSPDSRSVVFRAAQDGRSRIYRADLSDAKAVLLPLDGADNTNPSVSRDGRWLYFASNHSGKSQIWRAPFSGGTSEAMTMEEAYSAEESISGDSLFYWNRFGIHRMPLRDRLSTIFWKGIPTANFHVTGDGIYYEGLSGGDVTDIRYRTFDGTSPEQIFRSNAPIHGWSTVPGRHYVLMGLRRLQSNIEAYISR